MEVFSASGQMEFHSNLGLVTHQAWFYLLNKRVYYSFPDYLSCHLGSKPLCTLKNFFRDIVETVAFI